MQSNPSLGATATTVFGTSSAAGAFDTSHTFILAGQGSYAHMWMSAGGLPPTAVNQRLRVQLPSDITLAAIRIINYNVNNLVARGIRSGNRRVLSRCSVCTGCQDVPLPEGPQGCV